MDAKVRTLNADIGHAIVGSWRRWRRRRVASREIASCDRAVIEGIAREFGLSVGELRDLAELGPGTTDLLYQRLNALGIDRATFTRIPLLQADLERCCAQCQHKAQCAHELDAHPRDEHWQSYCSNALTLSSIASAPPG